MKSLPLTLAIAAVAACLALPARAASPDLPDPAELEAFLHDRYFEVEFFVFERPDVLDFANGEILTLNRPRALPRGIRSQDYPSPVPWTSPIDRLTRACLTFPTVTWELVPEEAIDVTDPLGQTLVEPGEEPMADTLPESVPVPGIEPVLEPDPMLDFLTRVSEFERTLQENGQRWQAPDTFQLAREAARIERRGSGRILFHGRWLQAVPPREQPDPILVTGGESLRPPLPARELMGSVGVTLGRYLHFRADLFFHGPGLGLEPAAAPMTAGGEAILMPARQTESGYMVLSESRRMRSEELHYLDHPKLGLVVRIDPVRFPDELVNAYMALKEE